MKINVNRPLTDLEENPLKSDGQDVTVGSVLTTAALAAPANPMGAPYQPQEQIDRYHLALSIKKAPDGEVELSSEMASKLKADVCRLWGPIVAGQVLPLLDGK